MKAISTTLLVLFTMPLLVFGKGATYKTTLSAPGHAVEITDAKALNDFRFGPGPGNTLNGFPNWKPNSWIVEDWVHAVAEPEHTFPRLKASFHINPVNGEGTREYVIYYVYDPAAKQGYVYLPGRGEASYRENVSLLYRGDEFEGHWFRATPEWTKEVQAAIERAGN
jgi:hypothetical protein